MASRLTVNPSSCRTSVRCAFALVLMWPALPAFAVPSAGNGVTLPSLAFQQLDLADQAAIPSVTFAKKDGKGGGGGSGDSGKDKNDKKDKKDKDKKGKDKKDKDKKGKDKKDKKDKDKKGKDKKDKDKKDKKDKDKKDKKDKDKKDQQRDDGHDHENEEGRHEHDNGNGEDRHDHDNNEDRHDHEGETTSDSDSDEPEGHEKDDGERESDSASDEQGESDASSGGDSRTSASDDAAGGAGSATDSTDESAVATSGNESGDTTVAAVDEGEPSQSQATSSTTQFLMLSGTPPEAVRAGDLYLFTPGVESSGESPPTFNIDGLPLWAGFNEISGELYGAPDEADIGFYDAIMISATDGVVETSLPPFSIEVVAPGASQGAVTLSWMPPTENEDGSYLADLAGYWIYWGNNPGTYTEWMRIDNPGLTTIVIEDLVPGTWEFAMTSFNAKGVESRLSSAVTRTVGVDPIEPAGESTGEPAGTSAEPLLCGQFTNPGYKGGQDLPDVSGTEGLTFGPGRHVITEQILLSSGDVLSGAGSDQTTLYFPDGLIGMGHICPDLKDCWSWENGVIVASGTGIGVQNVTIEFPAHTFTHYKQELGAQPGYNGVAFETCENCWAKDVHIINSDVGFIARWSNNVTIEDTSVTANNDGSHIHYAISTYSKDVLVNVFSTHNDSYHGLTAQWGVERGVFSNGTLIGPTDIEPEHNGPVSTTLFSSVHGDVRRIQKFNRDDEPVSASFVDVNGETFEVPCTP